MREDTYPNVGVFEENHKVFIFALCAKILLEVPYTLHYQPHLAPTTLRCRWRHLCLVALLLSEEFNELI